MGTAIRERAQAALDRAEAAAAEAWVASNNGDGTFSVIAGDDGTEDDHYATQFTLADGIEDHADAEFIAAARADVPALAAFVLWTTGPEMREAIVQECCKAAYGDPANLSRANEAANRIMALLTEGKP